MTGFGYALTTEEEIRELIGEPGAPAANKEIFHLDEHCRAFIAHSPFVVMSTHDSDGSCDASPKGGPPGFVKVLDDHRLALPDAPGNRRADSLKNILATGRIGLIFLIPRYGETLRVEGRATITTDPELIELTTVEGKPPSLVLGVEVDAAYLHCAKAIKRSKLWDHEAWPDLGDMPSAARIFKDHIALPGITVELAEHHLAEDYQPANLW